MKKGLITILVMIVLVCCVQAEPSIVRALDAMAEEGVITLSKAEVDILHNLSKDEEVFCFFMGKMRSFFRVMDITGGPDKEKIKIAQRALNKYCKKKDLQDWFKEYPARPEDQKLNDMIDWIFIK